MLYYHICVPNQRTVKVTKRNTNSTQPDSFSGEFRQDKITNEIRNIINNPDQLIDEEIQRVGEALFEALFDDQLRENFLSYNNKTNEIRVILEINEEAMPEVITYPWEFMCLPERFNKGDIFFATDRQLSFSRCRYQLEQASKRSITLDEGKKLKIALAVSNPTADPELNGVEFHEVNKHLEGLNNQKVKFLSVMEMDPLNIIERLEKDKPDIFHFIGHGRLNKDDESIVEIAVVSDGQPYWKDAQEFAQLFSGHPPKIVILQACETGRQSETNAFSSVAYRLMLQGVSVVIAMQFNVSNQTASIFVKEFYSQIVNEGSSVEMAVQKARLKLVIQMGRMRRDFAIPVIYMNAKDGYLFPQQNSLLLSPESTNGQEVEVLPFINSYLLSFNQYTKSQSSSRSSDKDKINFVKNWTSLFKELEFCKDLHNKLHNFNNLLSKNIQPIIQSKDDYTYEYLREKWDPVYEYYEQQFLDKLSSYKNKASLMNKTKCKIDFPTGIDNQLTDINEYYSEYLFFISSI